MALAIAGNAEVWGALKHGLQLFTWQGLACRYEAAGVGRDAEGGVESVEKPVLLPLLRRSLCFGPMGSWRGLTPTALCSELLFSEPAS